MIGLIEKYRPRDRKYGQQSDEKDQENLQKDILDIFTNAGAKKIYADGYLYKFLFNGMQVSFVQMEDRLCGDVHRVPVNKKEKKILTTDEVESIFTSRDRNLIEEFREKFLYEEFSFEGDILSGVSRIINLARKYVPSLQ